MRASKQARARASRFIARLNQAHDLSKSDAHAPRASLAICFNIINERNFSRWKKLHAADWSSLRPEKSNAYMQGSSLLALKRKIQDVENTKSAGNLERIKREKNWPSFKTFKMTDGYLKLRCLSDFLKIPVPEFETARFAPKRARLKKRSARARTVRVARVRARSWPYQNITYGQVFKSSSTAQKM